jgi:hypothetical protein
MTKCRACGVCQLTVDSHLGWQIDHTALDFQFFGLNKKKRLFKIKTEK